MIDASSVPAEGAGRPAVSDAVVIAFLLAAIPIWVTVFVWTPINFWFAMALGTGGLGVAAVLAAPRVMGRDLRFEPTDLLWGLGTAVVLYGVFWVGRIVTTAILPFAGPQIGSVYEIKGLLDPALIALLMALVIGPGEELFWRGFLQRELSARFGAWPGYLWGVAAYALVHVVTGNVMLILAAGVAGLMWGFMYMKFGRLWPAIVSHVIWDLAVFLILPLA